GGGWGGSRAGSRGCACGRSAAGANSATRRIRWSPPARLPKSYGGQVPSGRAAAERDEERPDPAAVGGGGAAKRHGLGRVEAVRAAGGGAAGAARGPARAGAEPALHPAAPVWHC